MKPYYYMFLFAMILSNLIQSQNLNKKDLLKEIDYYDEEKKYPKKIIYKDFDLNIVIEETIDTDGELISSFHFDPNTGNKNGPFKFLSSKYYYDSKKVWDLSDNLLAKEKHYNTGVYNQGLMNSNHFEILIKNRNNRNYPYTLLNTSVLNGKFDDELKFYTIGYEKPKYVLNKQNKLVGKFIGIQDRYQMLNKDGDLMFINGEAVYVDETTWEFSFKENNKVSLMLYFDGTKYSYQGSYYIKEELKDKIIFQGDLLGKEDNYTLTIYYNKITGELICSNGIKGSKDFTLKNIFIEQQPSYYFKKDLISAIPIQKGKFNDGVYSYDEFTQVYFNHGAITGIINKNEKKQTVDSLFRDEKIWKIKEKYKKNNGVYRGSVFDPITYFNKIKNINRSLVSENIEYAEGYKSIEDLRGGEILFSPIYEDANEEYYSIISQEYNNLESKLGTFFSYQNDISETLSLIIEMENNISYENAAREFKEKGIKISAQFKEKFNTSYSSHIRKNFRYPEIAQEMGIQGKVKFQAILSKYGEIINIKIIGNPDINLKREVLRLLKSFSFDPFYFNEEPINIPYSNYINFNLK